MKINPFDKKIIEKQLENSKKFEERKKLIEKLISIFWIVIGIIFFLVLITIIGISIYNFIEDQNLMNFIFIIGPLYIILRYTRDFWEKKLDDKLDLFYSKMWLKGKNQNGWTNEEILLIYSTVKGYVKEIISEDDNINMKDYVFTILSTLPNTILKDLKMSKYDINKLEKNYEILRDNSFINFNKLNTINLDKKRFLIQSLYYVEEKSIEINKNINKKKSTEFLVKLIMKIDPDNELCIQRN